MSDILIYMYMFTNLYICPHNHHIFPLLEYFILSHMLPVV